MGAGFKAKVVNSVKPRQYSRIVGVFSILLALVFSVVGFTSFKTTQSAQASGFLCEGIGHNMTPSSSWGTLFKTVPLEGVSGARSLTIEQAFGGFLSTPVYTGETSESNENNFILANTLVESGDQRYDKNVTHVENSENLSKMQELRTVPQCVFPIFGAQLGSAMLLIASIISSFMSMIANFAFDPNIICSDPDAPTGGCFNIVGLIGGTNGSGGLIGALTGSIFTPLVVIAVAIAGITIGYKGIVQRRYRDAFSDSAWVLVAVFFGVIVLSQPQTLAKAPMAVSNSIAACVIGAFNGENCFDGTTTTSYDVAAGSSENVCNATVANASVDEKMSLTVSNMGCSIWKAFVLEPYTQANFGTNFEDMDVYTGMAAEMVEKAGVDPTNFCVNLGVDIGGSETISDMRRGTLKLQSGASGSSTVCNLAAYQLYLGSNASMGGNFSSSNLKGMPDSATMAKFSPGNYDPRWYQVIAATSANDSVWTKWSSQAGSSSLATGAMAVITSALGSIVIIVTSLSSLTFYLSAIILMAFAPLFFLFAIHPTKGKKIFLGWLEKVVSNLLKYLASAFFLLIAIAFYGGILGSSTNPMMTFIFVLIMTFALLLYRKELLELIGRVNMGGEQMGSRAADWVSKKRQTAKTFTAGAVGAAVGSAVSGDGVVHGLREGAKREVMRGSFGNTASSVVRQASRNSQDASRFARDQATTARQAATDAKGRLDDSEAALVNSDREGTEKERTLNEANKDAVVAASELKSNNDDSNKLEQDLRQTASNSVGGAAGNRSKIIITAADAIKDANDFTTASVNSEVGQRASGDLALNESQGDKLAQKISEMSKDPDNQDPSMQNSIMDAADIATLTSALSNALRTGNLRKASEIKAELGYSGLSDADALEEASKLRSKSIAQLSYATGRDDLRMDEERLYSGKEVSSKMATVQRGRQAEVEMERIKTDVLKDSGISNEEAADLLSANRENEIKRAAGAVGGNRSKRWVEGESSLDDGHEAARHVQTLHRANEAQRDIDKHLIEHREKEKSHQDLMREYEMADREASIWGEESRRSAERGAVNARTLASTRQRATEEGTDGYVNANTDLNGLDSWTDTASSTIGDRGEKDRRDFDPANRQPDQQRQADQQREQQRQADQQRQTDQQREQQRQAEQSRQADQQRQTDQQREQQRQADQQRQTDQQREQQRQAEQSRQAGQQQRESNQSRQADQQRDQHRQADQQRQSDQSRQADQQRDQQRQADQQASRSNSRFRNKKGGRR